MTQLRMRLYVIAHQHLELSYVDFYLTIFKFYVL